MSGYVTTLNVAGEDLYIRDLEAHENIEELQSLLQTLGSFVYPVGSIYMTMDSLFEPSAVFGGTWKRIAQGRTLVGVDEDDSDSNLRQSEKSFGSASSALPVHTHSLGSHTHTIPGHTHGPGSLKGYYRGREDDNDKTGAAGMVRYAYSAFNTQSSAGSVIINSGETAINTAGRETNASGSGTTGSTGSSALTGNYQPSLTTYIWQRTA